MPSTGMVLPLLPIASRLFVTVFAFAPPPPLATATDLLQRPRLGRSACLCRPLTVGQPMVTVTLQSLEGNPVTLTQAEARAQLGLPPPPLTLLARWPGTLQRPTPFRRPR